MAYILYTEYYMNVFGNPCNFMRNQLLNEKIWVNYLSSFLLG